MTQKPPVRDWISAADSALRDGSFVKLSLGNYTGAEAELKNIIARKILIKREEKLSFTYRYKTRDIVKNYAMAEALALLEQHLRSGFHAATLFTTAFDLVYDSYGLKKNAPTQQESPSLDHDRSKKRLISAAEKPYLHALGITDAHGSVLKTAQDKYRQINKYIETLSALIKTMPPENLHRIVDMGSGKGYLTFALYDYLSTTLHLRPQVIGVEYRADLVALCNKIAKESQFDSLNFVQGSIADFDATGTTILIALHACDTATDDAIAKGIKAGAEAIVVAPCCHKQIRREIEKHQAQNDLDFLMKHGIFIERQAEMVTDGLRALILEYFGYQTKVFEFISDAHTPKNVMIIGSKNPKAKMHDPAILKKITAVKTYFGIERHHLETMTGL